MLFIVVGIAVVALLALLVATWFGSLLAGWITVWASAVGLSLLLIDGLHKHEGNDAQQDAAIAPSPRLDVPPSDAGNSSVATELTDDEVELHPDIWPPGHPVHQTPGEDSRIEPRRASEGESLHPDIWP
jgi:hypothetical protein